MKKPIAASLLLLILVLAACSNLQQPNPTIIPTSTLTALPPLSPTNTRVSPTQTPDAVPMLLPEGQPAPQWNGIPIMPEAIAGEGDDESYVFTVKATPEQVQAYYQLELGRLGWQLLAKDDGDLSLIFTDNTSATFTISIISKGEQVLVLLVK